MYLFRYFISIAMAAALNYGTIEEQLSLRRKSGSSFKLLFNLIVITFSLVDLD